MIESLKFTGKLCLTITVISFIFAVALSSCDCGYKYEFIVENKTSSTVRVYCRAGYCCGDEVNRNYFIPRDSSKVIWGDNVFAGGGCPGPFKENCQGIIDSVLITRNDTLITKSDYRDVNIWSFKSTGTHNSGKGIYSISLTDNDFIVRKAK